MEYAIEQLRELVGEGCLRLYEQLDAFIEESYAAERAWSRSGKYGEACLRYRKGGKTLCTLYFRRGEIGVWIILGGAERTRFTARAEDFSEAVREKYRTTETYHDGKWLMFDVSDDGLLEQFKGLLLIKRKPNIKAI